MFYLQFVAGRFEEGLAEIRRCVETDPLSSYNAAVLGVGLGLVGYHEEAIDQAVKATELDPDAFFPRWILQLLYGWASRYPEAEQAGEEALAISGRHPWAMAMLAATYGNWGKPEKASASIVRASPTGSTAPWTPLSACCAARTLAKRWSRSRERGPSAHQRFVEGCIVSVDVSG